MERKVRSFGQLQSLLSRAACLDAYYSTSTWLNPHRLGRRTEEDAYGSLFLRNDIFFDIDFKPFSMERLEKAREETVILLAFLASKGIPVRYIAFSGSKGFHVCCKDDAHYGGGPLQRELAVIEERKRLVAEVRAQGISIDSKITTDTRRIVRVPGTVNSKSGYLCRLVDEDELLSSHARDIVKRTPRETVPKIPPQPRRGDESDGTHIGIKTNVLGTRRSIVSMGFGSYRQAKEALLSLEGYGIRLAFLLKRGRRFYVVSPSALDPERALKISRRFSKADGARYARYGYTTFPADAKPLYHREFASAKGHPLSKAHLNLLLEMFALPSCGERLCGEERLSMDIAVME